MPECDCFHCGNPRRRQGTPEGILRRALERVGNLSSMVRKLGMLVRKVECVESRERMDKRRLTSSHAQSRCHSLREKPKEVVGMHWEGRAGTVGAIWLTVS